MISIKFCNCAWLVLDKNGTREVPEMKKATLGVKGIKLNPDDFVSNVYLLDVGDNEVVEYKGKKVELRKLKIGKRGTKGVKVRR